ncbi:uncharacterized protein LOC108928112 [Scleropages formosus]|uniref:uncharacterized protein LOC108928112 n=1 Tax=Scleropages formosus TaxID=113540 RepID=UPI0010FA6FD0|nr:uncharacterized protein LOC108928112 [Scleropages formosus]
MDSGGYRAGELFLRYTFTKINQLSSGRLFYKKNPQEGQEKCNSIINVICNVNPWREMLLKDVQMIENMKWDPHFLYDPQSWNKSKVNVKNYGRMIHSSKVHFRFLHCQDVHECYLDLFETRLHFVSNSSAGLIYQVTLPLKELTICKPQTSNGALSELETFAFQINGVSLKSTIVYCKSQGELDHWLSLLTDHLAACGGTSPFVQFKENSQIPASHQRSREELRMSVQSEPIYEWEGSHRDSLGPIICVSKVTLQHLPCQEQHSRLLVMYPSTLIILSEENNRLFYKGKILLNTITVTTPCHDLKPNTFMIKGKLINPIIVSCLDMKEFSDWICKFRASRIPIQTPPPPVYDIIYTPIKIEAPEFHRWSAHSSQGMTESWKLSQSGQCSKELQFCMESDNVVSPGYSEPLFYISSRPTSTTTRSSTEVCSSISSKSRLYPLVQDPMSPIYSTPYLALQNHGPIQWQEKVPLTKTNSLNTLQTSVSLKLSNPDRHSATPTLDLDTDYSRPVCHRNYIDLQVLPSFKLRSPPLDRRNKNTQTSKQEIDQFTETVSGMKLISPTKENSQQMKYNCFQDKIASLELTESQSQVDYANIWESVRQYE